MKRYFSALGGALAVGLAATAAQAATGPEHATACFASNQWQGWSAPAAGDGDVLYLRVNMHDVYQVDLVPGSHARKYPGSFLVNRVRGSDWICSSLDLDLSLSDDLGFRQPLIARSMRKLSPVEIAAIPKKDLP